MFIIIIIIILQNYRHESGAHRTINYETTVQIAAANRLDLTDDGTYTQKALHEGADASLAPIHYLVVVEHALKTVADVADDLVNGKFDRPASPPPTTKAEAPWDVRAAETRASLLDTLGLGGQLEARTEELQVARAALRAREKELAERQTMDELAGQRTDAVKQDLERQVEKLSASVEDLKTVMPSPE